MLTADDILRHQPKRPLRIGIGVGADEAKVNRSAESGKAFGDIIVYSDAMMMCEDLKEGRIDAAVRGDMASNEAMAALKNVFGLQRTQRVAVMEPLRGGVFLLAPVGIDEGTTIDEKEAIAVTGSEMMRSLGGIGRVGVMSSGRESDIGRSVAVDRSIAEAKEVCARLRSRGIEADHAQITIESALDDDDVILAPDGIIGNIIFRTLHFLGGAKALGAPVVNIPRVFIDTSRVKEDYQDSIALAHRLATEAER